MPSGHSQIVTMDVDIPTSPQPKNAFEIILVRSQSGSTVYNPYKEGGIRESNKSAYFAEYLNKTSRKNVKLASYNDTFKTVVLRTVAKHGVPKTVEIFWDRDQLELKDQTIRDWMNKVAREANIPWTKLSENPDTITYIGNKRGRKSNCGKNLEARILKRMHQSLANGITITRKLVGYVE
jgi:hypothetical protein